MAQTKTKPTKVSVAKYIGEIADEERRQDCRELVRIMTQVTGESPKMWGPSIIGFGSYHYKYESGHEGDAGLTGFASRKPDLVVYVAPGVHCYPELLAKLGKHTTGRQVCLYIKRLSDVDMKVLKQIIDTSVKDMKRASSQSGPNSPTNATRAQRSRS